MKYEYFHFNLHGTEKKENRREESIVDCRITVTNANNNQNKCIGLLNITSLNKPLKSQLSNKIRVYEPIKQ